MYNEYHFLTSRYKISLKGLASRKNQSSNNVYDLSYFTFSVMQLVDNFYEKIFSLLNTPSSLFRKEYYWVLKSRKDWLKQSSDKSIYVTFFPILTVAFFLLYGIDSSGG